MVSDNREVFLKDFFSLKEVSLYLFKVKKILLDVKIDMVDN